MINRRQFLGYSAGVLSAVALAKLPKLETFTLDSKLVMSDLREVWMYNLDTPIPYHMVRWDIRFLTNGKGKWRQYGVDSYCSNLNGLKICRQTALAIVQREFDSKHRIRANLLPLQMPRIMSIPQWACVESHNATYSHPLQLPGPNAPLPVAREII